MKMITNGLAIKMVGCRSIT